MGPGPPYPPRAPRPGAVGPWTPRSQYLAGNLELLGSQLNVFYGELTSCRGVSEGISSSNLREFVSHVILTPGACEVGLRTALRATASPGKPGKIQKARFCYVL